MGSPARTSTDSFEVYLIFPLAGELGTVQVVQRTLLVGGIVLALALTLIAALVASQVVRPVRRAAASARKLAAGDLAERMPVSGPIELTTLASSFNGMAEAIRVQIRQLEEFGKLQRRFTSDVSHELRTPLTTVRMAADVLHAGREDFPPHLARATELLVDELDRFESLLADLLEISRYDAGMAELSAEPIDIRSSINTSIAAAASLAEQFGIADRHDRARPPGGRRDRHPAGGPDPAQPDLQRDRPRRRQTGRAGTRRRRRRAGDHRDRPRGRAAAGRGRAWCSTGSGGPTRPGSGRPAAPAWGWRSRWRTPGCTAAGCRPPARRGRAPGSGSPCPARTAG